MLSAAEEEVNPQEILRQSEELLLKGQAHACRFTEKVSSAPLRLAKGAHLSTRKPLSQVLMVRDHM